MTQIAPVWLRAQMDLSGRVTSHLGTKTHIGLTAGQGKSGLQIRKSPVCQTKLGLSWPSSLWKV